MPFIGLPGVCENLGIFTLGNNLYCQGFQIMAFTSRSSFKHNLWFTYQFTYPWMHISNCLVLFRTCKSFCCQIVEATCCASPHVHLLSYPTNITRIVECCIYFIYGKKTIIFKNISWWWNHTSIFNFYFQSSYMLLKGLFIHMNSWGGKCGWVKAMCWVLLRIPSP